MVERIRLLLARFSENEATVRRLTATEASFDALCHEYRELIEFLDRFEAEVSLDYAVRPEGARHQWRKVPHRELSIDLVADERFRWATGQVEAS